MVARPLRPIQWSGYHRCLQGEPVRSVVAAAAVAAVAWAEVVQAAVAVARTERAAVVPAAPARGQ